MTAPEVSPTAAVLLPKDLRITSNSIQDAQDWKVLFHIRVDDSTPPMIKIFRAKPQDAPEDVVATIRYRRLSAQPDINLNIMGASKELVMKCRGDGRPIQYAFESSSGEEKSLAARRTWVMGGVGQKKGTGSLRDASEGDNEIAALENGTLTILRKQLQQDEILEILLTAIAVTEWAKRKWRAGKAKSAGLSALLECVSCIPS